MLVYLDTCILIYYYEQTGPLHQRAANRVGPNDGRFRLHRHCHRSAAIA